MDDWWSDREDLKLAICEVFVCSFRQGWFSFVRVCLTGVGRFVNPLPRFETLDMVGLRL